MENIQFFNDIISLNEELIRQLNRYSGAFVLCDENTLKHCLPHLHPALSNCYQIKIASGERNKNLQSCEFIWSYLSRKNADRNSVLINLGGGVISDLGGFAASCFKRGIGFINIPTTLLSMADASAGSKTGIDFNNIKNQIGLFSEAKAALICNKFLETLDGRNIRSGLAEIIKHYLIADEFSFRKFHSISGHIPDIEFIERAVRIKMEIVGKDPLEMGLRKILNFGHTIGHAIEGYYLESESPLLHGEAIAIGMAVEIILSQHKLMMQAPDAEFAFEKLKAIFELLPLPDGIFIHLLPRIFQDKKNNRNEILMSLPDKIGSCLINVAVEPDEIESALRLYNENFRL